MWSHRLFTTPSWELHSHSYTPRVVHCGSLDLRITLLNLPGIFFIHWSPLSHDSSHFMTVFYDSFIMTLPILGEQYHLDEFTSLIILLEFSLNYPFSLRSVLLVHSHCLHESGDRWLPVHIFEERSRLIHGERWVYACSAITSISAEQEEWVYWLESISLRCENGQQAGGTVPNTLWPPRLYKEDCILDYNGPFYED